MRINVQYTAQIKAAAGVASDTIEIHQGAGLAESIRQAARQGNDALHKLLIREDGSVQPTLLLFVDDECISHDVSVPLRDGQTLTIMSPISGG